MQIVLGRNTTNGTVFVLFHIFNATGQDPGPCPNNVLANPSPGETIHMATSPTGPWQPFSLNISCNNPAPMQHPNGTWYVVCNTRNFVLYRAKEFSGPYTKVAEFPTSPALTG